jgi:hypothetical protein
VPRVLAALCLIAIFPASAHAADVGGAVPFAGGGIIAGGATVDPAGATAKPARPRPTVETVPGAIARLVDGHAVPPAGAPLSIRRAILEANRIVGKPYVWGGGHRSWIARGYDCSGAVSFALHAGGLLASPLDSGSFMRWGARGAGRWFTVYTNRGHAYLEIAGLRLDTSRAGDPRGGDGPRWRPLRASHAGFRARHIPGL